MASTTTAPTPGPSSDARCGTTGAHHGHRSNQGDRPDGPARRLGCPRNPRQHTETKVKPVCRPRPAARAKPSSPRANTIGATRWASGSRQSRLRPTRRHGRRCAPGSPATSSSLRNAATDVNDGLGLTPLHSGGFWGGGSVSGRRQQNVRAMPHSLTRSGTGTLPYGSDAPRTASTVGARASAIRP